MSFDLLSGFLVAMGPVVDDYGSTLDNFGSVAFLVIFAEANPFTQQLGRVYLHERDVVLSC